MTMMYCPKFSVGSTVTIEDEVGEFKVVGIDVKLSYGKSPKPRATVTYFVEIHGDVKRVGESYIRDAKEVSEKVVTRMDEFLADSLLLSRDLNPEVIDNSIKELLNNGGEANDKRYEGLL